MRSQSGIKDETHNEHHCTHKDHPTKPFFSLWYSEGEFGIPVKMFSFSMYNK